jgi:hypothetical protein
MPLTLDEPDRTRERSNSVGFTSEKAIDNSE